MIVNRVVLRDTRDEGGTRYLEASIGSNGDLIFSGQDLGPGVEGFFGASEYEWVWTVAASDCKQLLEALASTTDLLEAVSNKFSGERASDLQPFLKSAGIPYDAWSRVGD